MAVSWQYQRYPAVYAQYLSAIATHMFLIEKEEGLMNCGTRSRYTALEPSNTRWAALGRKGASNS
jgi:hypothetical protein